MHYLAYPIFKDILWKPLVEYAGCKKRISCQLPCYGSPEIPISNHCDFLDVLSVDAMHRRWIHAIISFVQKRGLAREQHHQCVMSTKRMENRLRRAERACEHISHALISYRPSWGSFRTIICVKTQLGSLIT